VLFRHVSHVKADPSECTSCHPRFSKLFEVPLSKDDVEGLDFHGEELCGRCHDGSRSFGVGQDTCGRCHEK
jgi:c(7)-type cytochrome triheme protein